MVVKESDKDDDMENKPSDKDDDLENKPSDKDEEENSPRKR